MDDVVTAFAIGRHVVGDGRCFVLAEVGVNHNGDVALAHLLIDAAADAGCDGVKLQVFEPDLLVSASAPKAPYQIARTGARETQRDMLAALTLPAEALVVLARHAVSRGLAFVATPFDDMSVARLRSCPMAALKIASGDVTHHSLIAAAAATGLPLLISTGMSTLDEVAGAVAVVRRMGGGRLALLHCLSQYPAPPGDCNLRAIETLRRTFDTPSGWSDHTEGLAISLAAAARGADLLEKHLTLDRRLPGPDHAASLEPAELRQLVRHIREIEDALGDGVKRPAASELDTRSLVRRSLHLRRALARGHVLTADDLVALRPSGGLSPDALDRVLGRPVRVDLAAGHRLIDGDLEQAP